MNPKALAKIITPATYEDAVRLYREAVELGVYDYNGEPCPEASGLMHSGYWWLCTALDANGCSSRVALVHARTGRVRGSDW